MLITAINSDIPGPVIAQVRENVYDTVTGNALLVPQGARLLANYDSMVSWGQERILVCWRRLLFPNGDSINLQCAPAADLKGAAGLTDEVDEHWVRLIAGAGITSLLAATAQGASAIRPALRRPSRSSGPPTPPSRSTKPASSCSGEISRSSRPSRSGRLAVNRHPAQGSVASALPRRERPLGPAAFGSLTSLTGARSGRAPSFFPTALSPECGRCAYLSPRSRRSPAPSPMPCRARRRGRAITIRCGPSDVVAWCAGHILETAPPEAYGEAYKAWRLDVLPIVPREWRLEPKAPELLSAIARLLKHADRVVHAGDPDREGQLLVDEVLSFLGYRGPVERLLISDLSPPAVRQKLGALEPNAKYRPLSDSALARQRADWLYGINMTRLYTLLGRQTGYDGVLSVGRVQTPLLGLIVRRDRAIERFKPSPYFTVTATLQTESGAQFRATWLPGPEHEAHLDDEKRLLRRQIAEAVIRSTQGAGATVASRADKPCTEPAPLPYALADLQMDAGKRLGLSAQEVLDAAQSLYETHQLLTYPRSDCPYLPEAHHAQAPAVLAAAARQVPALATLVGRADRSRRSKAWADGKVTAHHAIIPTPAAGPVRALTAHEAAVYELVSRRYLAQFPGARGGPNRAAIHFAGATFRATGRRVVAPGWKAVLSNGAAESDDEPEAPEGDNLLAGRADGRSAPRRERLGRRRKDAAPQAFHRRVAHRRHVQRRQVCERRGDQEDPLGRRRHWHPGHARGHHRDPLQRGYVERVKKTVVSTPTGRALVDALPAVATTPDMTAVWEAAMRAIVERRQSLDLFLTRVEAQLRQLVEQGKARGAIAVAAPPAPAPRAVDARRAPRGSTRRSRSPSPAPKTPAGR